MPIDLDVMREIADEARRLCYEADRIEAGSDMAKTLGNCDRLIRLMCGEIEQLRRDLAAATARAESAERERDLTADDLRILRDDHAKLKLRVHKRAVFAFRPPAAADVEGTARRIVEAVNCDDIVFLNEIPAETSRDIRWIVDQYQLLVGPNGSFDKFARRRARVEFVARVLSEFLEAK